MKSQRTYGFLEKENKVQLGRLSSLRRKRCGRRENKLKKAELWRAFRTKDYGGKQH